MICIGSGITKEGLCNKVMLVRENFLWYLFCLIIISIYWRHLNLAVFFFSGGWSGGAMVLGKLPVPGRPTVWIIVGQGPTALAGGADGGCLDIFFSRLSFLFSYSLSLGDGPI